MSLRLQEAPTALSLSEKWSNLRLRASDLLALIGRTLDGDDWLCLTLLALLYVPLVLLEAHAHLLSNDEIYTVHIARAPTIGRMLTMAREIDLHPPLHYLLQRAALHLPGPRWMISRLPSMVAGFIATWALFRWTGQRMGNLLGLVSVLVFWTGPVIVFAWQNRPYMLWMCFLALLMLAWRSAVRGDRSWWTVAAVFCCSLLMISDQLFGIACLLPFWMAEAVRFRERGRADPALWAALTAPAVIGFGYGYQLRHLGQNSFPSAYVPTFGYAAGMYNALVTESFFLLSVAIILSAYVAGRRRESAGYAAGDLRPLRLPVMEGTLLGGLILLPVLLMAAALLRHIQFWDRYASCAVVGLAGLLPWMLYRRVRPLRLVTTLLVLCFAAVIVGQMVSESSPQGSVGRAFAQTGRRPLQLAELDRSLPIVAANPMTFTEMSDREPIAIVQRTYYLTSVPMAERYSGYTLFENEEKIRSILQLPSHAEAFESFVAEHPQFYMIGTYDRVEDWLPRALADRGADLDYLGKFVSTYGDDDLYLVTMRAAR